MLIDVSGVGRPTLDIIEPKLSTCDVVTSAVTFTAGDRMRGSLGSSEISLPKEVLVSRLQALLQTNRIRMPDNERTRVLSEELRAYEVRVSERTANLTAQPHGGGVPWA